ncbi:MAG: glycosyltransferase [Dokdonella sp.]
MKGSACKPRLSVVVVAYNMAREAPRTLRSLAADYQRHIEATDYEVIVVDNGSMPALDPAIVEALPGNFHLLRIDPALPSPAQAVNRGLALAQGDVIGVMIDGARIATPGLLHFALGGAALYPHAVVASVGWFVGFDVQKFAIEGGHTKQREDALLASIDWPADGYRLFEIGTLDGSWVNGWFQPIAESNGLFLRREMWDTLGGFDERFDVPGGGLVNLDVYRRALELPDAELVVLLGEGTFHQMHGGTATNSEIDGFEETVQAWVKQYEAIHGKPWTFATPENPTYLGTLPSAALAHFARLAIDPVPSGRRAPLGDSFDRDLWSLAPIACPDDARIARLINLAHAEFRAGRKEAAAAIARIARQHAPDELESQRLLAHAGPWLRVRLPPKSHRAEFHLVLGHAYRILDDADRAAAEYREALQFDDDLVRACLGLVELRMPGDGYFTWLDRLHAVLNPETYLEIGIFHGESLALARSPTCAIGVDPAPAIQGPLRTTTHIFCETSDAFFANRRLDTFLAGKPLALAFIDGLHEFSQSLQDFINIERCCGPQSVVLIHDTIPFDEITQRPHRQRKFYTGDVWKTVLCLRHYRPDLEIFTIATPPTGLTVVLGVDPNSCLLSDNYSDAVAMFNGLDYTSVESDLDSRLGVIGNDWALVKARLKSRGIIS